MQHNPNDDGSDRDPLASTLATAFSVVANIRAELLAAREHLEAADTLSEALETVQLPQAAAAWAAEAGEDDQ